MESYLQLLHVLEKTVVLRWYDLLSLNSKIYFNLHFAVCRRVPSGFQMLKGTGEREYDSEYLKMKGFLVFKLQEFNALKMILFTTAALTLPSFLVIWIFHMI